MIINIEAMAQIIHLLFASILLFFSPEMVRAGGICQSRVEIYGYPCQEHTVTTDDGYILSIQRIPNGRSGSSSNSTKIPVLLQHGLFMDGYTWLLNSPDESLAYILADNGYDVWIANTRGTIYSQGHTSLSVADTAYWDWSWDELVAYDMPATFKYVYSQTSGQKMHYVGHSLGTLIAIASLSQSDNLNMWRSAALLSPIAYLDHVSSALAQAAAKTFIAEAVYWLGFHEFDPTTQLLQDFLKKLCSQSGINCYDFTTAFLGKNCCLNSSTIQLFLDHEPQPSSTRNIIHLAQMIRRGTVAKYDYGSIVDNLLHYGHFTPPSYDLSAIPQGFPLFISYGGPDDLADVQDVRQFLNTIQANQRSDATVLYVDDYAHLDFVMAVNANVVVYEPLMAFFTLH